MTDSDLSLATAIRTTGTVRAFTDEPVDDATLYAVLDDARFAPSGGNRQPWRVAIVRDPALRRDLAALMRLSWNEYRAIAETGANPFAMGSPDISGPVADAANPLLDRIESVPVVLAIAGDRTKIALMDGNLDRPPMTNGGSVYPFCWNLLLAARARGLGGVMTTFLSRQEAGAAPLLGLPPTYALATTMFLGHPVHQPTKLRREPVKSFATIDRFDGDSFDV